MNDNHPKSEIVTPSATEAAKVAGAADPMEQYKIRAKANIPHKTFLGVPGKKGVVSTTDWLEIRSSLSDAFREASDVAMQKSVAMQNIPHEETRMKEAREIKLEMYASLVAGWSFNTPCTKQAVIDFLREAPQIMSLVEIVADEGETFFGDA